MKLSNKILYRSCKPCDFTDTKRNLRLAQQMLEFMRSNQAIGLAANQVGINCRLFVMKVWGVTRQCFNPEIIDQGSEVAEMAEGCLSFSKKQCTLVRPMEITVRYQDYLGNWEQHRLRELESRCYQHELDHLNGITMWHRQEEQHAEQS